MVKAIKKTTEHSKQLSKLKKDYIGYYRNLPIQKLAAKFIGKDEDTIIRWKKNDKKFADQVASSKSAWALKKASKVRSTEWLLERVMKEHFMERKEVDVGTNDKIDEALDRLAKMLP